MNDNVNVKSFEKPLIKYEFVGGKYPVFILFEGILLIAVAIIFGLLCTLSNNSYIFELSGIPKTIYLELCISCIVFCAVSISYALIMYFHNRGTGFMINQNGIIGTGLVKELNNSTVKFKLNYSQIDVITIKNGYINISSNGMTFHIMLTSRDFIRNLKKAIAPITEIQQYTNF